MRLLPCEKNAMQFGHFGKKGWALLFDNVDNAAIDPIMGWIGSTKPGQKILYFSTQKSALEYCARHAITPSMRVLLPHDTPPLAKSYAENFTKNFRW